MANQIFEKARQVLGQPNYLLEEMEKRQQEAIAFVEAEKTRRKLAELKQSYERQWQSYEPAPSPKPPSEVVYEALEKTFTITKQPLRQYVMSPEEGIDSLLVSFRTMRKIVISLQWLTTRGLDIGRVKEECGCFADYDFEGNWTLSRIDTEF